MPLRQADLNAFIARSDELGGPGSIACRDYWEGFEYQPTYQVDQSLDPFSDAYVVEQMRLYEELTGREYEVTSDEKTSFKVDLHVEAVNPYNNIDPAGLALHMERLSRAVRLSGPPHGGRILDMGCGWGLSSELAAYAGCKVTSVDINPDFVSLVNRRAARFGSAISATQSTFDTFASDERFDLILFYECLHHAVRPWEVLRRMRRLLAPGGKVVACGEPINELWWKHWGLRLDAISVYCIRKFGWFESGWSQLFFQRCMRRAAMQPRFVGHAEHEVGIVVVATAVDDQPVHASEIARSWAHSGWSYDPPSMAGLGRSDLTIPFPERAYEVELHFANNRGAPIALEIEAEGSVRRETIREGGSSLTVERGGEETTITFRGETWSPAEELGVPDNRRLSAHLKGAIFRRDVRGLS